MENLRQLTPRTGNHQCAAGQGFSEDDATGLFTLAGNDQCPRLHKKRILLPIIDGSDVFEDLFPEMMRNFRIPISGRTTSVHASARNQQTAAPCFGNGNRRVTAFE